LKNPLLLQGNLYTMLKILQRMCKFYNLANEGRGISAVHCRLILESIQNKIVFMLKKYNHEIEIKLKQVYSIERLSVNSDIKIQKT
jgi:hypothetical protein